MNYRSWIKNKTLKPSNTFGDTHWTIFEAARKKHNENICLETNKLVLKLDQLINLELDQSIEWTPDELVDLCPFCAKSFSFARRRHHCRVCGAILCESCSKFLDHRSACKLVRPAKVYTDPYDRIEDRLQDKNADEMPNIRTCEDCKRLLDKRLQTIEDYYSQPTFLEFYEKLRNKMSEADELALSQEESKRRLQEVKQEIATMSAKLGRMAERQSGKQAYLLKSINESVGYWFKESIDCKFKRSQPDKLSGWAPDQSFSDLNTDEHPLLIQIKNLEEYIKQARSADRLEEVRALEESKRDLEIEYLIQQDLNI